MFTYKIQRILQQSFVALSTGKALSHDDVQHHLEHCFDYLRQAIMCAGDMSLEGARIEPMDQENE